MTNVSGPTASLPGSSYHELPEGQMCDDHPDVVAVKRIQGETDSFGAEYFDACEACHIEFLKYRLNIPKSNCDWCGKMARLHPTRDYDEGMLGPVHLVCINCTTKRSKEAEEELRGFDTPFGCVS